MTENKKKLKLPENIKIKDDESGEVLELKKEDFMYGDLGFRPSTSIVINEFYLVKNTDGDVFSINGVGNCSHHLLTSFNLPQYLYEGINVNFYLDKKNHKEDCSWVKNHLDKFDFKTFKDKDDNTIPYKRIYERLKDEFNFPCYIFFEPNEPFISIPINKKFFNFLCKEIDEKKEPKMRFELCLPNSYKLTSTHKNHKERSYLYIRTHDVDDGAMGIAKIEKINSGSKENLKFFNESKEIYINEPDYENDDEEIESETNDTNDKILLYLKEIYKKTDDSYNAVVLGLIIIIILLIIPYFN